MQIAAQGVKKLSGMCYDGAWEVLAEKLGRGVWLNFQISYPIYDPNLQFSLPEINL